MNNSKSVKIIVATHKKYWMPKEAMYLPLHVGAEGKTDVAGNLPAPGFQHVGAEGKTDAAGNPPAPGFQHIGAEGKTDVAGNLPAPSFQKDNTGENISARNNHYCELTGLFWAWKNLDADYIGLAHYRRHFAGSGERGVISEKEVRKLLLKAPVILPKKRRYFIETIRSHYGNTFDPLQLDVLREALNRLAPDYLPAFDKLMKSTSAHLFNMFVMRADLLNKYCAWLFPILEETEAHISFNNMTAFENRCMGRLSERLMDVWINTNKIPYTECRLVNMEPVNWLKKGSAFLMAKFFHKKYERSF